MFVILCSAPAELARTMYAAERLPNLPAGSVAPVTIHPPPASPVLLTQTATEQMPPRLRRSESFLGLHFDFHAGPDCNEVGKNTTRVMIENLIDRVQPDYIQIDGKGHPGYSSYPTKVGNPVPGFAGDPLRLWRDVTSSRGVALYLHYSGVFDMHAVKNPGWAAINAEGQPHARATSLWGPYTDKLLIPQLRELRSP